MRANAEAGTLGVDGGGIGGRQIFLAEMNIVGPELEGLAPVVVDDQLTVMAGTDLEALRNFAADAVLFGILEAQLNGLDAQRHQPAQPIGLRNNGIECVEGPAAGQQDPIRPEEAGTGARVDGG